MDIMKIAILGVAGTLLALQLKGEKPEYGIYICMMVSLVIFFCVAGKIKAVLSLIREITSYIDLAPAYTEMLIKMLGITFVAEFSSAICKDTGYQTIAQQIEVFAKIAVLILGMPVVLALLETIRNFLS